MTRTAVKQGVAEIAAANRQAARPLIEKQLADTSFDQTWSLHSESPLFTCLIAKTPNGKVINVRRYLYITGEIQGRGNHRVGTFGDRK